MNHPYLAILLSVVVISVTGLVLADSSSRSSDSGATGLYAGIQRSSPTPSNNWQAQLQNTARQTSSPSTESPPIILQTASGAEPCVVGRFKPYAQCSQNGTTLVIKTCVANFVQTREIVCAAGCGAGIAGRSACKRVS